MIIGVRPRRASLLLAFLLSAAALLALPSGAAGAASAQLSTYEYGGWCCSGDPQTLDGTFRGHEFGVENDGTDPLALETLRITFDPTKLRWETGADADTTDSEFYVGFDDGVDWNVTNQQTPLSAGIPPACVEESATASEVVYACDLDDTPILAGHTGWTGLKALLPAAGFLYGSATVDYEISFVGAVLPPFTHSEDFDFVAQESNLKVTGGYAADPALLDVNWTGEYRDYDNESSGVRYGAGDVVPYRILLQNPTHATDPTAIAHGISVAFEIPIDSAGDWETQFQDASVTTTGGLTNPDCVIDSDDGSWQGWICTFDGHVPVDGSATITLPVLLVDGVDLGGGSGGIEFSFNTANGTIGSLQPVEENTYGSTDTCQLPRFFGRTSPMSGASEFERYLMFGTASIAELEAGDPIRFQLPCLEPEASPLTNFSSTTGIWDPTFGYSNSNHLGVFTGAANASYSWLVNSAQAPGPNGEYAFTWQKAGLTGLTPGEVLDTVRIAARPAVGGDYYRIMFHVTVEARSDLSATLAGPSSLVVASGGSQATYTATVANAGPDAATSSRVKVQLPATASFVSGSGGSGSDACTAAGQLVTCTVANLGSGASRAFTIVASYKAGTGGLVLPATANVTATAELLGAGTDDPDATDDAATASTSLTAAATTTTTCPAGQIGVPPICITPLALFGGTEDRTFIGSWAPDTFTGGRGNETFRAGSGGDTASGGRGDDRLFGGTGADRLFGGVGDDRLFGGNGDDRLRGGAGNDHVHGGGGLDVAQGDDGDDRVSCGAGGAERAFGGSDDDVVSCLDGAAGDTISGGPGDDLCIGEVRDTYVGCERILRVFIPTL